MEHRLIGLILCCAPVITKKNVRCAQSSLNWITFTFINASPVLNLICNAKRPSHPRRPTSWKVGLASNALISGGRLGFYIGLTFRINGTSDLLRHFTDGKTNIYPSCIFVPQGELGRNLNLWGIVIFWNYNYSHINFMGPEIHYFGSSFITTFFVGKNFSISVLSSILNFSKDLRISIQSYLVS